MEDIDYVKGHGASPIIKVPKMIDSDLSYILGALRDGGIHYDLQNNTYKIHFEEQNKEYLEQEIQSRLERLFELDTRITLRPDGVHQIQFASKPIYLLFSKCFGMREIQQFWNTPIMMRDAPKYLKREYIRGFFDAEGTIEHLYHSWFSSNECPPLKFISDVLNYELGIRCSEPLLTNTSSEFNRFPAFQIYINDYDRFKREVLGPSMYWH
jgi:intein-encoded DNA endonuclease-like protein